jgi:hypothetical protein
MEIVGCRAENNSCPFRPPAMLFHGISGGHIQGIMEEMERRSKTEARLTKGTQLNGRDAVRTSPGAAPGKQRVSRSAQVGDGGSRGLLPRDVRKVFTRGVLARQGSLSESRCLRCCSPELSSLCIAADPEPTGQRALEGAGVLPANHKLQSPATWPPGRIRPPPGQALVQLIGGLLTGLASLPWDRRQDLQSRPQRSGPFPILRSSAPETRDC